MPSGRIMLAGLTRNYLLRSDFSFSTSFPTDTDTETVAVQSDGEVIYAGGLELMDYPISNTAPLLRRYLGEATQAGIRPNNRYRFLKMRLKSRAPWTTRLIVNEWSSY